MSGDALHLFIPATMGGPETLFHREGAKDPYRNSHVSTSGGGSGRGAAVISDMADGGPR
jgi:hypothetical protein